MCQGIYSEDKGEIFTSEEGVEQCRHVEPIKLSQATLTAIFSIIGGDKGKWKEQSEAFRDALKQAKDTGAAADTPIIVAAPEAKKTKAKGKK